MPNRNPTPGRLLYFAYDQASLKHNCGNDEFDDLSDLGQATWETLAQDIDFEPSDELLRDYEAKHGEE